ncbi:carbohydrate kinase family protein [Devosia nitrariae]|uniref:Ribokinase n=1 Tax=Devosia nitrariae TaxID=2071872 RepID=A0ABQ5W9V2_9HYPH|nr:carbohydrate kinase family protein [Devosia nitrariae]GLQ56498.1 ribokinase [Devosia nitrariae]
MRHEKSGGRALLSLGRVYSDMVFNGLDAMPELGRELFARDFVITPGGGAFITAAHAVAVGRPAALVARYGTDAISRGVENDIAALGVDLRFLERHPDAGPQVTVVMVREGERAFLSRRAGRALPATLEAALDWPDAAHLHIAEYATLHEIPHAIDAARERGHTVSLDPSWDSSLIGDPLFFERVAGTDVFLPNLEEARALTGQEEPTAILEALARHFPVVALKCGADGAWLSMNGEISQRAAPAVEVIDTTGAGDAFNAGFLNAWLEGAEGQEGLTAAIDAGSRSVRAVGGIGSLTIALAAAQGS